MGKQPRPDGLHRELIDRADAQLQKVAEQIAETRRILRLIRDAGHFTETFNRADRERGTDSR